MGQKQESLVPWGCRAVGFQAVAAVKSPGMVSAVAGAAGCTWMRYKICARFK